MDSGNRSSRILSEGEDEAKALQVTGEILRQEAIQWPPAEGGDYVLCLEMEDEVDCASYGHEPATQRAHLPGALVQLQDGFTLLAFRRGFLQTLHSAKLKGCLVYALFPTGFWDRQETRC
jgi:hypothetical protein